MAEEGATLHLRLCGDYFSLTEKKPKLCVYTSFAPGYYEEFETRWEKTPKRKKGRRHKSVSVSVTFPKVKKGTISLFDAVYVSAYCRILTEDCAPCYTYEGTARIAVSQLSKLSGTEKSPLVMYCDPDKDGLPFYKGFVSYEASGWPSVKGAGRDSSADSLIQKTEVVTTKSTKNYWDFWDDLTPTVEFLRRVQIPVYASEGLGPLPAYVYFMSGPNDDKYAHELFMYGLLKIALDRRGVSESDFVGAVRGTRSAVDVYDAAAVVAEMISLYPAATAYAADTVDESRRIDVPDGPVSEPAIERKIIDSFGYLPRLGAADCEDDVRMMYALYTWLLRGGGKIAASKPWHADSAWEYESLDAAQQLCSYYFLFPSLGSVKNYRQSGDIDKDIADGKVQSHMFAVLVPELVVADLVDDVHPVAAAKIRAAAEARVPAREKKALPLCVCEGTGAVDPLVLEAEWYGRKGDRRSAYAVAYRAAYDVFKGLSNDGGLAAANVADTDAPYDDFYGQISMSYSCELSRLFAEDGDFGPVEFAWMSGPNTWGPNLTDVLRAKKGISLRPVRTPGKSEKACVVEALRHEPPRISPLPYTIDCVMRKDWPRHVERQFIPPFSAPHFNADTVVKALSRRVKVSYRSVPSVDWAEIPSDIPRSSVFTLYAPAYCRLDSDEAVDAACDAVHKVCTALGVECVDVVNDLISADCANLRFVLRKTASPVAEIVPVAVPPAPRGAAPFLPYVDTKPK